LPRCVAPCAFLQDEHGGELHVGLLRKNHPTTATAVKQFLQRHAS
jgi:hypothetical protein